MPFIDGSRRQEPQASRYEVLHGVPQSLGSGASSPSSGFIDFDRALLSPAKVFENGEFDMVSRLYAGDATMVASEFNERLLIVIGGFTYSHSVYHALPASPVGPITGTSLATYSKGGVFTVGTLGTSFGQHQYWESWEYGIHALDALTQTLSRSGGCNVKLGLFELPVVVASPALPPKAGSLIPSGKSTPSAMPAVSATVVGSGGPTVSEWTTLFESLNVSPFFGNTNLTFANKSMFLTVDEATVTGTIHGLFFGAQAGLQNRTAFVGLPLFSPVASQGYLVFTYGDNGAATFPTSQFPLAGVAGDRIRWWDNDGDGNSYLDFVPGLAIGLDGRQEPNHILYEIADAIMEHAFDQVDKRAFYDRTINFALNTRMPMQGFPPVGMTVTGGSTPGTIEVGWTAHIAAPDDNTEGRWNIYLSTRLDLTTNAKRLRETNDFFTPVNLNRHGLQFIGLNPIDKINTPSFVKVISGLASGVTYFVTMTNKHFNCYLLRSSRGVIATGPPQQGQVEIAESEIFLPVKSVVVP